MHAIGPWNGCNTIIKKEKRKKNLDATQTAMHGSCV
jgi:hypothetical protein